MFNAHQHLVYGRRIRLLSRHFAGMIPRDASVLDVGAGDGSLARLVMDARPDVRIRGVDVLARASSHIPVALFDGIHLPFATGEFDVVTVIDVLHHAANQDALLSEIARVARHAVIIKDHIVRGLFARRTLAFMDWVGNARNGISLPYAYWTDAEWRDHLARAGLSQRSRREHLALFPWPVSLLFERRLHFIGLYEPQTHA